MSMRERGGTKRIASLHLRAANIASVVSQNFTLDSASFALHSANDELNGLRHRSIRL
jgi:hypothetical protein